MWKEPVADCDEEGFVVFGAIKGFSTSDAELADRLGALSLQPACVVNPSAIVPDHPGGVEDATDKLSRIRCHGLLSIAIKAFKDVTFVIGQKRVMEY